MQKLKEGGITSAIHIILTYIEGDGEPLARCNVLPGKHCRAREEKKKRFDFYLAAAVKNSAHDASSPVGRRVREYGSQYTQHSYVVRDVPPPTHTHTHTHKHMHIKTHTMSIK